VKCLFDCNRMRHIDVPTICDMVFTKNPKLVFYQIFVFLAIIFETEILERRSRALKTRIISWFALKILVKKLTLGLGVQGSVTSENAETYRHYDVTHKKPHPKLSTVLLIWCTRHSTSSDFFEQLSSSIGWRVMVVQSSSWKVAHAGLKGSTLMLSVWLFIPYTQVTFLKFTWKEN